MEECGSITEKFYLDVVWCAVLVGNVSELCVSDEKLVWLFCLRPDFSVLDL